MAALSDYDNDLTRAVTDRVGQLRLAKNAEVMDSTTLLAKELVTARSTQSDNDDLDTCLLKYLTQ